MASPADLTEVPLFDDLDEGERIELARWFEERSVGPGVRLVGEGTVGYSFFVLVGGAAEVVSGDETLGQLVPGDFFGEVAILGDGRRSATVTTTEPSKVLAMFGTEFRRLQAAQPAIAESILRTMKTRVAAD
ncbi:MAG TPA: cyclic nucleotide-binding domain-containing protein [Gaiella sp.]|jgi:voltage-gated potassium channel